MRITQSFEPQGLIRFPITLSASSRSRKRKYTISARMDTGFNGFLWVPNIVAEKVGLVIKGTAKAVIAHGKTIGVQYSQGRVGILRKSRDVNTIIVAEEGDILIGMEFLEAFGLKLIVDPVSHTAILTDESIHL
jgi:clan AA aspartic protease